LDLKGKTNFIPSKEIVSSILGITEDVLMIE
jgi:hypothetical protein